MRTGPIDVEDLLGGRPRARRPACPTGTRMGHVHLHVADIPAAAAFYHDMLGFDVTAHLGDQAELLLRRRLPPPRRRQHLAQPWGQPAAARLGRPAPRDRPAARRGAARPGRRPRRRRRGRPRGDGGGRARARPEPERARAHDGMTTVADLELPQPSTTSTPTCAARASTRRCASWRAQGWLAADRRSASSSLDREAGRVLPAHQAVHVPGHEDRRDLRRSTTGRCTRRSAATSSTSTAPTTGACAASSTRPSRRAPPSAGARRCAASSSELLDAVAGDGALRVRRGLRQALPVAGDRDGDGRAARRRAAAARVVELDPAPVRRADADRPSAPRIERAVDGVLRLRRRAARAPPRRPRRRPDLAR